MFTLISDVADLPTSGQRAPRLSEIILRHLMDLGRNVTAEELENAIYAGREDGGALTSRGIVQTVISRDIRPYLKPGFGVVGYHFEGYRLEVSESVILERVAEALAA